MGPPAPPVAPQQQQQPTTARQVPTPTPSFSPSEADAFLASMEKARGYTRYRIKQVREGMDGMSKVADVIHPASGRTTTLTIGPPWSTETLPRKHDIVHVVGNAEGGVDAEEGLHTVVDRTRNYMVLHPDVLISPSSVISGLLCDRRAALQFSMSSSSGMSPVTVMGHIKHSLIQATLLLFNERERLLPRLADGSIVQEVERVVDHVVQRFRVQLYGLRVAEAEARQELLDLIRPLVEWTRLLYLPQAAMQQQQLQQQQQGGGNKGGNAPLVEVHNTENIEETIWSAAYGLKGNIDATLIGKPLDPGMRAQQQPHQQQQLFPLELKSGSSINETEHRGQVMLYSLLLQDRYGKGASVPAGPSATEMGASRSGILAYVRAAGVEAKAVVGREAELRQLLIVRNRVAQAFMQTGQNPEQPLPPILAHPSECSKCFQVAECMVYHQAFDNGTAQSSSVGALFDEITGHLQEVDRAYLRKWEKLIGMEAIASVRGGRGLWHRRAALEEELSSRCFSDMVCKEARALKGMDGPAYLYRFTRRKWEDPALSSAPPSATPAVTDIPRSLHEMAISVGDRVLVSTESVLPAQAADRRAGVLPFQHLNLTAGTVSDIGETSVDIICNKAIAVPGYADFSFSSSSSSASSSSSTTKGGGGPGGLVLAYEKDEEEAAAAEAAKRQRFLAKDVVVFRIDRDQASMGSMTMRSNVLAMFSGPAQNTNHNGEPGKKKGGMRLAPTPGDEKRRRLVVHLEAPLFTQPPLPTPGEAVALLRQRGEKELAGCAASQLQAEFVRLNSDQQRAVEKVLTAKDFALLLGMPGTGKTWTIAFVVRALVCTGKSVLITSYTHSAVDTLLLKLREFGVPFVRLGRSTQVRPALHDALLEADDGLRSMAALDAKLGSAQVVATTCLGMRHPALASRRFDVCIVDEAGQILEPVCLGPLRLASSFVLVGDANQLPPLVVSPQAAEEGMAESLFSRLAKAHPVAVQRLTFQYRMNRDIMSVCNTLVYDNQLRCEDESVANATLTLPFLDRLPVLRAEVAAHQPGVGWLEACFVPERAVLFLDTDGISPNPLEDGLVNVKKEKDGDEEEEDEDVDVDAGGEPLDAAALAAREAKKRKRKRDLDCPSNLTNPTEARLVAQLVTALVLGGVRAERVAVISPLRSQLKLLRRQLQHIKRLEVNTVDKLQGMDRDCIIISMVRSNTEGTIGHLLQDRRRINVAVSRAKKKLLIVGSATTLAKATTTCELVDLMQTRGWVLPLPADAHRLYEERNLEAISLLSATQ